ncbi:MAG: type II methionyl aminopeptidase [Crenarchaeota archaeon]|nr:type II methionyl aminopeptidase [Thermoproteota archaeon]
MDEHEFESYMKAGEIACRALKYGTSIVREGARVLEIAQSIESMIRSLGGDLAFPVNISINEVAAHYTPVPGDELRVPPGAVVKIDVGVHVDGYIADTAATVSLDPSRASLLDACREALERGLQAVSPGTKFNEFGRVVETVLKSRGFKPVYNLSGHSLDRYTIHAGDVIPNYRDIRCFSRFRDGRAYALEPFATPGSGLVEDGPYITIYAIRYSPKKVRSLSEDAKRFLEEVYSTRKSLPFATRWYVDSYGPKLESILKELRKSKLLIEYPVLIERSRSVVAQFEHTIVLYKGRVYVTTAQC